MLQAGPFGNVREGAVAIVPEEMAPRLFTCRKTFQAPAVHQENIQPAIVVIIVESQAAAGSFQKVPILTLAPVDGFHGQSRLFDYILETEAERRALDG